MRIIRGVSTVKRALPEVTMALAGACGLEALRPVADIVSSNVAAKNLGILIFMACVVYV